MLVKKTIVLTGDVANGYVSIVRVGSSAGAKIIFNSPIKEELFCAIKLTNLKQVNLEVNAQRTEIELPCDFTVRDDVGIIVTHRNGEIYAVGGNKMLVNKHELINYIKVFDEPIEIVNPDIKVSENKIEVPETIVIEESSEVINDIEPILKSKSENFYSQVRSRLNEILTVNPREERVEALIPDSTWVKVYYDKEDYYIIGVLREDNNITHIGYGVPGVQAIKPPKEAEDLCDFLPLNGTIGYAGDEEGYWIMFQDASTGEINGG